MDREEIIEILSKKLKLIRTENDYTQDKMADVLGLSKKTLVQVEKGRSLLNWTTAVALVALFRDSEILLNILGDSPLEVLETIVHKEVIRPKDKTMGGRVWWENVEQRGRFRLQQNILSKHFRILDEKDYRWYSSFNQEEAHKYLDKLIKS